MISYKTDGFVLVATLWVLAALSMFVGYIALQVDAVIEDTIQLKSEYQLALDRKATETTLLYLAATRPMTYAGLTANPHNPLEVRSDFEAYDVYREKGDEIRFDNRAYNGIGSTLFSIQDAGSLISLRGEHFWRLEKLLESMGVSRWKISSLVFKLQDYTDRDRLLSLDGAEYEEYRRLKMIQPTNRFLVSPVQLLNIIGWSEHFDGPQLLRLLDEVTIYVANLQNFNTMTASGIRTLGEIDDEIVDKLIKKRETVVFHSLSEVNRVAGSLIPADPLASATMPSRYLRMSIWNKASRQKRWIGITLTPLSPLAPWQIDYRISVDYPQMEVSDNDLTDSENATVAATIPSSILLR